MNCPTCGEPCKALDEGECPLCAQQSRDDLHQHLAEFDAWQQMTPCEREAKMRWAIR